jgi:hypothetical protein
MCESDTSPHKESPNIRMAATHSHHVHHHTNQQSTATHAQVSPRRMFALPLPPSIALVATTTAHCPGPTFAAGFVMAAVGMGRMVGRPSLVLIALACTGTTTLSIQHRALTTPHGNRAAGGSRSGGGALPTQCVAVLSFLLMPHPANLVEGVIGVVLFLLLVC